MIKVEKGMYKMYSDDDRIHNSNECSYNGRKLSNVIADIKCSTEIAQVCIGAEEDDQFDALSEESEKSGRIKIGLEIDTPGAETWLEVDLEDVLRFAKTYCSGIYERVAKE